MKAMSLTIRSFILTSLLTIAGMAQTTGAITGTVTDATNAVIAGVHVTAHGKTADVQRETTTNGAGEYALPFLPPGDYEIRFHHDGFGEAIAKATVNVTERIAVDVTL